MRKSRYGEEQIIRVLRQMEGGQKIRDVCREHAISEQTYHRWKSKYGGMDVSEARRLKQKRRGPTENTPPGGRSAGLPRSDPARLSVSR